MDAKVTVAKRIRRARKERGWRQADLAQAIESNQRYISSRESGKVSMGVNIIGRIARALGKPIGYFFEEFEDGVK